MDEVAPETDTAIVLVDAINRNHVRVPHLGQLPRFVQNALSLVVFTEPAGEQQLEGNFALECAVEGAEDFAEGALPYLFANVEGPPTRQVGAGRRRLHRHTLGGARDIVHGTVFRQNS